MCLIFGRRRAASAPAFASCLGDRRLPKRSARAGGAIEVLSLPANLSSRTIASVNPRAILMIGDLPPKLSSRVGDADETAMPRIIPLTALSATCLTLFALTRAAKQI